MLMLGFRRNRARHESSSASKPSYRYRVESRRDLLDRYDLVALHPDRKKVDERQRLARVLEEVGSDGWRLVGISGEDFIFRRRAGQPQL